MQIISRYIEAERFDSVRTNSQPVPSVHRMHVRTNPAVLIAATPGLLGATPDYLSWLSHAERARADAFVFDRDRNDYIAAHLLVRLCAANVLNCSPRELTVQQSCPSCQVDGHGPPRLTEASYLSVAWSHTRGWVAAIAGLGRVGIDLERIPDRAVDPVLMAAVLTPGENRIVASAANSRLAFTRFWSSKEALIKAGEGSLDRLLQIDLAELSTLHGALDERRIGQWRDFYIADWCQIENRLLCVAVAETVPILTQLQAKAS